MSLETLTLIACALAFYGYGASCLVSAHMRAEFQRYGIPQFRKLTGILQLVAASGLLLGTIYPIIGGLAAAGIALQMACGLGVRIRIGDGFVQCIPATVFMLLCGILALSLI